LNIGVGWVGARAGVAAGSAIGIRGGIGLSSIGSGSRIRVGCIGLDGPSAVVAVVRWVLIWSESLGILEAAAGEDEHGGNEEARTYNPSSAE
jgi:hypothetical protein